MLLFRLILFVFFSSYGFGKDADSLAVIKDPVVNCYMRHVCEQSPASYSQTGLSSFKRWKKRCPSHQGLFNEVVTIVSFRDPYVEVAFEDLIYGVDEKTGKFLDTFWLDKKHLVLCENLNEQELKVLPPFIDPSKGTVILSLPWQGYSAGTRFARFPDMDTEEGYGIAVWREESISHYIVCKKIARIEAALPSFEKRKMFVENAYAMIAHAKEQSIGGVIPYVLGGSSYVASYPDALFWEGIDGFEREGPSNPYMGYDCSELIFRLAKISGIVYPYKTTALARKMLPVLSAQDELQEGDLIWFSGHLMIVSNLEKNEVIEAAGYQSGYGKVMSLSLSERFLGISTYKELQEAFVQRQPLLLLDKNKSVSLVINEFAFLKLL